jgi:hypothetical protein
MSVCVILVSTYFLEGTPGMGNFSDDTLLEYGPGENDTYWKYYVAIPLHHQLYLSQVADIWMHIVQGKVLLGRDFPYQDRSLDNGQFGVCSPSDRAGAVCAG